MSQKSINYYELEQSGMEWIWFVCVFKMYTSELIPSIFGINHIKYTMLDTPHLIHDDGKQRLVNTTTTIKHTHHTRSKTYATTILYCICIYLSDFNKKKTFLRTNWLCVSFVSNEFNVGLCVCARTFSAICHSANLFGFSIFSSTIGVKIQYALYDCEKK